MSLPADKCKLNLRASKKKRPGDDDNEKKHNSKGKPLHRRKKVTGKDDNQIHNKTRNRLQINVPSAIWPRPSATSLPP